MIVAAKKTAEAALAPDQSPGPRRMLNEEQVLTLIPLSRTTLFRMIKTGRFPKATFVSPNRKLWFAAEIQAWQDTVDERNPTRGRGKGRGKTTALLGDTASTKTA